MLETLKSINVDPQDVIGRHRKFIATRLAMKLEHETNPQIRERFTQRIRDEIALLKGHHETEPITVNYNLNKLT